MSIEYLRTALENAPDSQAKDAVLSEYVKTKCKNNAAYLAGVDGYLAYLRARKQSLSEIGTAIDHAAAFQAWVGAPKAKNGSGEGRLPSRDNVRGARHLYGEGAPAGFFGERGSAIVKAVRIVPLPPAQERERREVPREVPTVESEWRPKPAPTTAPLPPTAPTIPPRPATAPTKAPTITPEPTPAPPEPATARTLVPASAIASPPENVARLPYFYPTALPSYHGSRRKLAPRSGKVASRRLPIWAVSPEIQEFTTEDEGVEEAPMNPPDRLIEETASAQPETSDAPPENTGASPEGFVAPPEGVGAQPESSGAHATGRHPEGSPESPTLRVRRQGSRYTDILTAPFVQSGRLVAIGLADDDEEMIELRVGRTTMRFFLDDFSDLLQGSDNARYLLNDAVEHNDYVEIRVTKERLSYRNDAQYARVSETREKETAEEAHKAAMESAQRLDSLPALQDEIAELRKMVQAQYQSQPVVASQLQAQLTQSDELQAREKRGV